MPRTKKAGAVDAASRLQRKAHPRHGIDSAHGKSTPTENEATRLTADLLALDPDQASLARVWGDTRDRGTI